MKTSTPTPFVTVFSVTYNQRGRALETLADALAQDYPDDRYEIIFLDDGSTDGTIDALRSAAKGAAPSVRLIAGVHEKDYHHAALFNRCIAAASGDAEVFIQAEDVNLRPDFIRQHVKWHVLDRPHVVSGAKFEGESETWSISDCKRHSLAGVDESPGLDVPASAIWAASLSYPRSLVEALSTSPAERPYDERMEGYGHHEIEFALRLEKAGGRLVYDPSAGIYHKDHTATSESARGFDRERMVREGLAANARFICEKHGLDDLPRW